LTGYRIPRPATAFSLDRDRKSRGGRREERDHLGFIRKLPCCVCGSRRDVEAAHIRMPSIMHGKGKTGMGTKPDDAFVTPLCAACHRTAPDSQHNGSEEAFWERSGVDPFSVALALYASSGNEAAAELIIQAARVKARKAVSA
jgi:hypothetical protein